MNIKLLETLSSAIFNQMGFKRGKFQTLRLDYSDEVEIRFTFSLTIPGVCQVDDKMFADAMLEQLKPYFEDIESSPYFQDKVKNLNARISNLEFLVKENKKTIDELTPFETYYTLEHQLRHGKKPRPE